MSHHPSCRPNDKTLVYKCYQCGLEEPAEHLENLRAELATAHSDVEVAVAGYKAELAQLRADLAKARAELEIMNEAESNYQTVTQRIRGELEHEKFEHELTAQSLKRVSADLANTARDFEAARDALDKYKIRAAESLEVEKRYVAGYRDEFLKSSSELTRLKKLCSSAAAWMDGIAEPEDHPLRKALLEASK